MLLWAKTALQTHRAPHRQADPQTKPDTHGTNWCCCCFTEPRPRPPARQASPSASTACARARSVTRLRSHDSPAAWHARARPRAARGREARGRAPPVVGVVVAVIQRLNALGALAPRQLVRVGALEEARRELDEPLGVDRAHLAHVLLAGQHQLVVDDPVRLPLEERAAGVNKHLRLLHHRLVALRAARRAASAAPVSRIHRQPIKVMVPLVSCGTGRANRSLPAPRRAWPGAPRRAAAKAGGGARLLRVLARGVEEEAGADGLADLVEVVAGRHQVQLVPVHDHHELLAHVLRARAAASWRGRPPTGAGPCTPQPPTCGPARAAGGRAAPARGAASAPG